MRVSRKIFDAVFGWHPDDTKVNIKRKEAAKELLKLPYKELYIRSDDGLRLYAMLFEGSSEKNDKAVILIHGYNSFGINDHADTALMYLKQGYTVLIPDNRGAGKSEGDFQGFGIFESRDNLLWIDYLIGYLKDRQEKDRKETESKNHTDGEKWSKNSDSIKIVVHGCSMGSGTVCIMSSMELPKEVKVIISDCGFSAIRDEFCYYMKKKTGLKFRWAVDVVLKCFEKYTGKSLKKVTPLEAVGRARLPMLFIHGTADRLIPIKQSELLNKVCPTKKKLVRVEGAGHIQSSIKEPDTYFREVFEFIESVEEDEV